MNNSNDTNLLNEIKKISNIFIDNIGRIEIKLDDIVNRVKKIENKIEYIEKNIIIKSTEVIQIDPSKIKELKYETIPFELPETDVIKALNYRDHRSILYVLKAFYKNKLNTKHCYPIKIKGARTFEYYQNGEWSPDTDAKIILNILCKNIQLLFMKYNILENVGFDKFPENNNFILFKLSDEKFKRTLLPHIIEEIRQNN